jgi:hypothetical protein
VDSKKANHRTNILMTGRRRRRPRRAFVPQAQAAQQRLKHASALSKLKMCLRNQATAKYPILRRSIVACFVLLLICRVFYPCCGSVASPQEALLCADKAGNIYSVLLLICRVFFSCCNGVAWPQAAVWAPLGATITYVRPKLRSTTPPLRRYIAASVTLPLCTCI